MKYQCIQQHRGTLSIRASCGVLGVSQSGYYAWRKQQSTKEGSDAEEARWVEKIRQLHQKSRCTYGSPRITAALRDEGAVCNRKRIARLMGKYGICAKHKPHHPCQSQASGCTQPPQPAVLGEPTG